MNMFYYTNNESYHIGAYEDFYKELLPVIPCTESILFLANATATTSKGGKCAKSKYGDIYNTIISNFAMVQTDSPSEITKCMQDAYNADDLQDLWDCFRNGYTRMGGESVASGPNYKKPTHPDVDYDASNKVSKCRVYGMCLCTYAFRCMTI